MFALGIEPFPIAIRNNDNIQGIVRDGVPQKNSLYADNVIIFISNPISSFPHVLKQINQYSVILGYKLNVNNSELFPININVRDLLPSVFSFKITSDNIKYLWIKIFA